MDKKIEFNLSQIPKYDPKANMNSIEPSIQSDWLSQLNDYQLQDLISVMIRDQEFGTLLNLMCTCRHVCKIGQILLTREHQLLIEQQPSIIEESFRAWQDSEGLQHRIWDLPAVIHSDGRQEWWSHGLLHRDKNRPAIIGADGLRAWYVHGKLHRDEDQPAVIWRPNSQRWFFHGHLHRDGDQPAIIHYDGTKIWYRTGQIHRGGDQPAVIYANGRQEWYDDGRRYRPWWVVLKSFLMGCLACGCIIFLIQTLINK